MHARPIRPLIGPLAAITAALVLSAMVGCGEPESRTETETAEPTAGDGGASAPTTAPAEGAPATAPGTPSAPESSSAPDAPPDQDAAPAGDDGYGDLPGAERRGEATESDTGLVHWSLEPGSGPVPPSGAVVRLHAEGWLADGTAILDTRADGAAMVVDLDGADRAVPQALREAASAMRVGERRKLLVPPHLGFGATGQDEVPADATLVYDLQLVSVVDYTAMPPADELPGEPVEGEPQVSDSGLQWYDIRDGEGDPPPAGAQVVVHYAGYLVDGTMFDTSRRPDRGPFAFSLSGGVIQGWLEGVATMKVGGLRKLVIPGRLAYGPRGRPGSIPPDATLVFDVELLDVPRYDEVPDELPGETVTGEPTIGPEQLEQWVIREGAGEPPADGSEIARLHLMIYLNDGTPVANTRAGGSPLMGRIADMARQLPVLEPIVLDMQPGELRKVLVPPAMGFGAQGIPGAGIPGNALLVADVELVGLPDFETVPDELPGAELGDASFEELESGLRIAVLAEGEGPTPADDDRVRVHVEQWLTDGTKVDDTREGTTPGSSGEPARLLMSSGMIKGISEALGTMRAGSKVKLIIPSELAYGMTGRGGRGPRTIPPGATIICDLELVEIEPKD